MEVDDRSRRRRSGISLAENTARIETIEVSFYAYLSAPARSSSLEGTDNEE